ncbi:MAG: transporter related protein [Gemmatimonadetes bacterium]|nr:transporter related protein [Gemmatimonadota bacterium]
MISFSHVGKRYRGWTGKETSALTDFTLELREGEVFGLAGPNGAGKSTLISLLLGFLGPTEGQIRIDGLEPRRYVETFGIGYLSELINIPATWRVTSALERYALLAGVPQETLAQRVSDAIEQLGLGEHRKKRIRQLSKGNLQRVGLAQALLCEERIIVLDEPTHGLDPVWTQRFRDLVDGLRRPDRTILIASHNLDELARLADRVGIIDKGRLQRIVDVRVSERDDAVGTPYRLVMARGGDRVLAHFATARLISPGEFELAAAPLETVNRGLAALIQDGSLVSAVYPMRSELEQQFREAVGAQEDLR